MTPSSGSRAGRSLVVGVTFCAAVAMAACGAGNASNGNANAPGRASSAAAAMCPSGVSDVPFLVDGDSATRTYFATQGRHDVVFVRYDGLTLTVLEGCRDDHVPGSIGTYGALDEKTGPVETLDVADVTTMCAKLPLASGAFGERVRGGEAMHLSYYVSGTRTARRASIDGGDLARYPGCAGATHFVYAFDVGAFTLASARSLTLPEQKAGDVAVCAPTGTNGRTPEGCMVPIRVALRAITPASPSTSATASASATPPAQITPPNDAETAMYEAQQKLVWRDGPGCLAALDVHDKLDARPHHASTDMTSWWLAMMRAQCLMLAGQCQAGKDLFRAAWQNQNPHEDPSRTRTIVDVYSGRYCQGPNLPPRDRYMRARFTLQDGAWTQKKTPAECMAAYRDLMALRTTVTPIDDDDMMAKDTLMFAMTAAPNCFARAGDCDQAFASYREIVRAQYTTPPTSTYFQNDDNVRKSFASTVQRCKR